MPWRLLSLIFILALALVFVGFNLDNRCTVSFGFIVIEDVPVFFPLLASFTIGMIFSFPFVMKGKGKVSHPGKGETHHPGSLDDSKLEKQSVHVSNLKEK